MQIENSRGANCSYSSRKIIPGRAAGTAAGAGFGTASGSAFRSRRGLFIASSLLLLAMAVPARAQLTYRQGDCNLDGRHNIVDAVRLLSFLFDARVSSVCHTSCDTSQDGRLSVLDPLQVLHYVFLGNPLPGNNPDWLVATETCGDSIDNDCDGEMDEGCDLGVASLTLAWDPVRTDVEGRSIGVDGYEVYFGRRSGQYTDYRLAGRNTEITIEGLRVGVTYYFAVRAYRGGLRSVFSAELQVTLDP